MLPVASKITGDCSPRLHEPATASKSATLLTCPFVTPRIEPARTTESAAVGTCVHAANACCMCAFAVWLSSGPSAPLSVRYWIGWLVSHTNACPSTPKLGLPTNSGPPACAPGYRKNDLTLTANFTQQQTRGGGDIRRQDSPFVSNRVNFSKAGATLTYPIPRLRDLGFWLIYSNTFDGRNVGQASTWTTGLLYTFNFEKKRATP